MSPTVTAIIIIMGVLLLFIIISYIIGVKIFEFAFPRQKEEKETAPVYLTNNKLFGVSREVKRQVLRDRAWLRTLPREEHEITAHDGVKLVGRYYKNPDGKGRLAILVHGYRSTGEYDFSCGCPSYWNRGFDLFIIDGRGHGKSGGEFITFGVKEQRDVCDWCKYAAELTGHNCEILLGGMSMGCSVSLLAAAQDDFPKEVKCIVADCGYTSPYDEFRYVIPNLLKLPFFPSYHFANAVCRHRAGFGSKDVNVTDAVKKIKVPVLFIHGDADNFVPFENTLKNYEACTSPKDLLIVKGASHGLSFVVDGEAYEKHLDELIGKTFSKYEERSKA